MSGAASREIPIDSDFFCDGPCALLLSRCRGGTDCDPGELADVLGQGTPEQVEDLLRRGVCLPLFFGYDCALDGATAFVVGELPPRYAESWAGRLTSWLRVPSGQLVLVAGGGDGEELARAVSGQPPRRDYVIWQTIELPPGDYRVDVYAMPGSNTTYFMHEDLDEDAVDALYEDLPAVGVAYVVQLSPLQGEVAPPELVEGIGWPGLFQPRAR